MENFTTKKPDDYVVATGKQYSIKQFINLTAKKIKNENKVERKRLKGEGL